MPALPTRGMSVPRSSRIAAQPCFDTRAPACAPDSTENPNCFSRSRRSLNVTTRGFSLRKNMLPHYRVHRAGLPRLHIIASVPYLLALDEGTTSARAALYDERGNRLSLRAVPFQSMYPQRGWVEQDAEEIWQAQLESAQAVAASSREPIAAVGITNQRETV